MIVENGSVTMNLDLNRFNAISSVPARATTLDFAAAANSFFTILVFNDLLRSPEPGSMALVPESEAAPPLPAALAASLRQLVIEKLPSDAAFDLAVRDGKTGFTFFNIEGHQYDYDPNAQSLSITGGNLLVSQEFANALATIGCQCDCWQDLDWYHDAADRDSDNPQRKNPIRDHAAIARPATP